MNTGEKCVTPAPPRCTGRSGAPQDLRGRDRGCRGSWVLTCLRHTAAETACVKTHFTLLNLANKTGSNWNVKTRFEIFSFSPNPFF